MRCLCSRLLQLCAGFFKSCSSLNVCYLTFREIAAKEKKQKLEDRAEVRLRFVGPEQASVLTECYLLTRKANVYLQKRARLRENLNLERYETPPQSDAESEGTDEAAGKSVRVYQGNDTVTTVVTASVFLDDEG